MVTKARVLRAGAIPRERGISQAKVAELVGASQPQISRILKGDGIRTTMLAEEICLYAERLEGGVTAEAALLEPRANAASFCMNLPIWLSLASYRLVCRELLLSEQPLSRNKKGSAFAPLFCQAIPVQNGFLSIRVPFQSVFEG